MNITNNQCPAGILHMRRAFPVDPDTVRPGSRKGQRVADCHVCGHPDIPVVERGGRLEYSGHVESTKVGGFTESGRSYSQRRERNW